jgi:hypothetical protein
MDFTSQKFCNETSLGQNGPWDKTDLYKLATKVPILGDGLSAPENKN